ncbi:MAG: Ribosome biogenesis GTPase A [Candidatus Dichloromethanomonas elyunquensis]|nr:MAG: Ribosome biogenesis GTPase A [Candidatus Dichloromethanomonas elyunquensis]
MSIQWFPGHMTKAKRKLEEQLRWVDVVLELGDARLPLSSRNPLLRKLLGNKLHILLLNKSDLADSPKTDLWLAKLKKDCPVLAISAMTSKGTRKIVPLMETMMSEKMDLLMAKGVKGRSIRAMVVGIPNIGKSSLINHLTGGSQAKTGNKPGVTRGNQWIRIHQKVELLDTPGMLWPKFDDPLIGKKLAATGAIRDEVFDQEELAGWLLEWLKVYYPKETEDFYQLHVHELNLEGIGRKRGCLVSGGKIDIVKTSQIFLREFRSGRIAKVTMDEILTD